MLFKANITKELADDTEKLVPELYKFLNDFVRVKLKYEEKEEIEDCTQDTILYLLDRLNKLSHKEKNGINLEQFFYNRANSYTSLWLYHRKRERELQRKHNAELIHIFNYVDREDEYEIDIDLLKEVIEDYPVDTETTEYLIHAVINTLVNLGFTIDDNQKDYSETLLQSNKIVFLAPQVISEYLVRKYKTS